MLLADDGLVSTERNRGAFVSKPDFQEALDICEALIMIEQAVAAHLVHHLTSSGWTALKRHVAEQLGAVEPEVDRPADTLDREFQSLLVRLTRNTVVQAIHAQLVRRTTTFLSCDDIDIDYRSLAERHSKMIDHMERGRVWQVAAMIERHHLALLRNGLAGRSTPQRMTSNEVRDSLVGLARPQRPANDCELPRNSMASEVGVGT